MAEALTGLRTDGPVQKNQWQRILGKIFLADKIL